MKCLFMFHSCPIFMPAHVQNTTQNPEEVGNKRRKKNPKIMIPKQSLRQKALFECSASIKENIVSMCRRGFSVF